MVANQSDITASRIPPLENDDRLNRIEFEWRYATMPNLKKLEPDSDGIICSQIFPGLWLAASQLLSGEMNEVLAILQQGLDSSSHQEFCQRLAD